MWDIILRTGTINKNLYTHMLIPPSGFTVPTGLFFAQWTLNWQTLLCALLTNAVWPSTDKYCFKLYWQTLFYVYQHCYTLYCLTLFYTVPTDTLLTYTVLHTLLTNIVIHCTDTALHCTYKHLNTVLTKTVLCSTDKHCYTQTRQTLFYIVLTKAIRHFTDKPCFTQ